MHELPPLIHKARDRMIDVHHTILPRTQRKTPDPLALVADAVPTTSGFAVLCPIDMACHCAAHMLADGDLQGGRSEEHTSELQSLMRISYAVFCLKKKTKQKHTKKI